jgi:hypothetical protein
MWHLRWGIIIVFLATGCVSEAERRFDRSNLRASVPILVGNDGFLSGNLAAFSQRLARKLDIDVAIEPTPFIGKTVTRINKALRAGRPVFVIGYSAGCRDIVTALGLAEGKVTVFMIEPTYQATHGYARLPDRVNKLICFRISGGNALTFSGRDYVLSDFVKPPKEWENVRLSTRSHLEACDDPLVYARITSEIVALKTDRPTDLSLAFSH